MSSRIVFARESQRRILLFFAVAVSLLDDQTSSLVGVAISASLLPPAVNTGVLWVAYFFYQRDVDNNEDVVMVYDESDEKMENGEVLERYDFLMAGTISFLLTLSNVILVIIASILMFRLKEVSWLSCLCVTVWLVT